MSKYAGFKITSIISGILIPAVLICAVWLNEYEPPVQSEPPAYVSSEESVISEIELFTVDYDMYGNYDGSGVILCKVFNDNRNNYSCDVWLEDSGERITEKCRLEASSKLYVFKTDIVWSEPGAYPCTLVYSVDLGATQSRVECPFIILVNGGSL